MEFAILGPLEVTHDGEPVPLPGRTVPRLAAALLLDAGHVVTLPRLIDTIWDDDPPTAPRRDIQNAVSVLRKRLFDPGRELVETVGEGYRIRVQAGQLDALRFDHAVHRARHLARAGGRPAALAGLREALQWWRGPALAGLSGRLLESGAQRWDEARMAAVEARIDLELALDGRPPVIGELRELLAAHPHRQRMAGQLMLALHRDGRTTEALEAYGAVREWLVDKGMDPCQELRELHRAILRGDPSLVAPVPAVGIAAAATEAVRSRAPVPTPLPADTPHFTGRADQLAALAALADAGQATAVVAAMSGIGGAGKTALAAHWAHRSRDRFPDGVLHVDLRGYDRSEPKPPGEALALFLQALGVPPDAVPVEVPQARELYRSLLADKKVLVVLDNARDAGQVRPLLPGTTGSFTVVTSRHQLAGLVAWHDAHLVTVESLPAAESLRLLGSMVGDARLSAEPDAAQRLVELCAGLPLALRIAAANLVSRPYLRLADVVAALSGADRLDRLAVGGDPTATVAATFDLSYQAIDPTEDRLYLQLAFLPHHDIGRDLAVAISELDTAETERLLARLEAAHRIEQYRPGRYRFHDLVREYARRKALHAFDEAARQQIRTQVVDWYVRKSAVLPLDEYDNVVSAFHEWAGWPTTSRLANVLGRFANHGYRLTELARLAERGMEIGSRSDDPMDFAMPCNLMVTVSYVSGDLATSAEYGRKTLAAVERCADGDITGTARGNFGVTLRHLGRYLESEALMRESVRAAERYGDLHNLVVCLASLGEINHRLGRFAEAERHIRRAVELNESLTGGPHWAGSVLSLGALYTDLGRVSEAAKLYTKANGILDSYPSDVNRIRLCLGQARLHRTTGRYYSLASTLLTQALEVALETRAKGYVFELQYELAELLGDFGQCAEALDQLDRHAGEADRHHTPETRAVRSRVLCKIYARLGDHDRAVHFGRQACEAFAAMPDPLRHGRSLAALADAHAGGGDPDAAAGARRQTLAIFTELGVPEAGRLEAVIAA